jgi:hypothetical protein
MMNVGVAFTSYQPGEISVAKNRLVWKVGKHRATLTYSIIDVGEVTIEVGLENLVGHGHAHETKEALAARNTQYLLSNLTIELSRQLA